MTRSWLLRLAPLFIVALLGIPRSAAAAELRPATEPTRVAPPFASSVKALVARAEARGEARLSSAMSLHPAASARLALQPADVAPSSPETWHAARSTIVALQPPARAPPALS